MPFYISTRAAASAHVIALACHAAPLLSPAYAQSGPSSSEPQQAGDTVIVTAISDPEDPPVVAEARLAGPGVGDLLPPAQAVVGGGGGEAEPAGAGRDHGAGRVALRVVFMVDHGRRGDGWRGQGLRV